MNYHHGDDTIAYRMPLCLIFVLDIFCTNPTISFSDPFHYAIEGKWDWDGSPSVEPQIWYWVATGHCVHALKE